MERIPEILEHLEEEVKQAQRHWEQQVQYIETTIIKARLKEVKTKIEFNSEGIIITYLRSSYITESHRFKLAIYTEEPFVDDPIYHTYLNMSVLYQETNQQLEAFTKKLNPKFYRILPYEVEEIRRHYILQLYQNSHLFLEQALEGMTNEDPTIPIYFGEEMGSLQKIGAI